MNTNTWTHTHTHNIYIYIYMCVCVCVCLVVDLGTLVEGDPKALRGVGEGATLFPGLLHFTLDSNLIMLSAK